MCRENYQKKNQLTTNLTINSWCEILPVMLTISFIKEPLLHERNVCEMWLQR